MVPCLNNGTAPFPNVATGTLAPEAARGDSSQTWRNTAKNLEKKQVDSYIQFYNIAIHSYIVVILCSDSNNITFNWIDTYLLWKNVLE